MNKLGPEERACANMRILETSKLFRLAGKDNEVGDDR